MANYFHHKQHQKTPVPPHDVGTGDFIKNIYNAITKELWIGEQQ
jgi:hypothetical protein